VYILLMVLYGLKQASRELNCHADKSLKDSKQILVSVVKEVKGVMSEQHTLIALNVDGLLITCPYKQMN
jgi:hypothetical protein